jgi:hypothetical protein
MDEDIFSDLRRTPDECAWCGDGPTLLGGEHRLPFCTTFCLMMFMKIGEEILRLRHEAAASGSL